MFLIVQIALGIVLGFLLIQYHRQIGHGIWLLLSLLLAIAVVVFFVWVGSEAVSSITEDGALMRFWRGLTSMVIPLLALVIAAAGGLGFQFLVEMWRKPKPKTAEKEADWPIVLYSLANGVLVTLVYYGLAAITPLGAVGDSIDSYSRANGWQDGLTVFAFVAVLLWPWPVLFAIKKFAKPRTLPVVQDQ
jgi:hypothetical protein